MPLRSWPELKLRVGHLTSQNQPGTPTIFLLIPFCCFHHVLELYWMHVLFDLLSWEAVWAGVPLFLELISSRVSFVGEVPGSVFAYCKLFPFNLLMLGQLCACVGLPLCSWGDSVRRPLDSLSAVSGQFVFLRSYRVTAGSFLCCPFFSMLCRSGRRRWCGVWVGGLLRWGLDL